MPMPTQLGRYIAIATQTAVEQKAGKCPQWVAVFQLGQYFDGDQWKLVSGDLSITGYFTLVNNDGNFNLNMVKSDFSPGFIAEAYRLDYVDFDILATRVFSEEVQILVDHEEYNGKTTIKVVGIYPFDYEGRQVKTDPVIVKSLQSKYGALLKQHKPKTSAAARPVTATPASTPLNSSMTAAWKEFKAKTPGITDEARKASWYETVKGYGQCEVKDVNVDGWNHIANSIAEHGPYKPAPAPELEVVPTIPADTAPMMDDIPF